MFLLWQSFALALLWLIRVLYSTHFTKKKGWLWIKFKSYIWLVNLPRLPQKTNPLETWSRWITSFSQILFISPFTKLIFCIDSKIMCIFDNSKMLRRFRIIIYTVCIHEFVWMEFFFSFFFFRWTTCSHDQRMWYAYRTILISNYQYYIYLSRTEFYFYVYY